jgi:lysozyme
MTPSPSCIALIKRFEGCKLACYQDVVGVFTIGYGHTGEEAVRGSTITQDHAEELLAADIAAVAAKVEDSLDPRRVPGVTQNQFDACVSLAYNIGAFAFKRSTLCNAINAGHSIQAAGEFLKWDQAGGKVIPGLLARRDAERALFLAPELA